MKIYHYILSLLIVTVLASCYEDLGNYDYNENIYDISAVSYTHLTLPTKA